ncbi:hypothetical protein [Nostoc sp.]
MVAHSVGCKHWSGRCPEKVKAIAPIAVSGRHSAWCIELVKPKDRQFMPIQTGRRELQAWNRRTRASSGADDGNVCLPLLG